MRSRLIGLAAVLLGLGLGSTARAQDGGFSDPFFLYYGFYLPRQNALAAQPQPEDFYRVQGAQRQYAAQTDRAGLYAEASSIGLDELDPLRAFGSRSSTARMVPTVPTGLRTSITSPMSPSAPLSHFNRVGQYYPRLKSGRGAAPMASGRGGSSGMGGVGGMGMGGPMGSFLPTPMGGGMPRGMSLGR